MKKRRRMTAKQLKYFGKRKRSVRTVKVKGRKTMARRRSYRGRVRSYARKGIGGMKGMIAPVLGGFADSILNPRLPVSGVGATAVGIFMHDPMLKTIGLYEVGSSIGNIIPIPGLTSGGGGNGGLL